MKSHIFMTQPIGGILAGTLLRLDDKVLRVGDIHPGDNGDDVVELWDGARSIRVRDPETGEPMLPTLGLLRRLHAEGRVALTGAPENAVGRQARYAMLDPDACADRDRRSVWRYSLADRAIRAGVKMTDRESGEFLDREFGTVEGDLEFKKPSPSALRRWMSKLLKIGRTPATLISAAGRPRGLSPLAPEIDAIVHQGALFYWSRERLTKAQAHAWVHQQVTALNATLSPADQHAVPSKQTVYARIDRLRCFETVAKKQGQQEAVRQFRGSGEALIVNELLEVVLMDGTMLEQAIVFDDDWKLAACRVRIVALMEALSHGIVGVHVYAGPNRAETSIEAVLSAMVPPDVHPDALAEMPTLGLMYGRPRSILPDNEKALIGPSTIDSFNEVGIDVLLPPIEMPQAKASLERFWRTLKQALQFLPGTIIDPKRAAELGYDPEGATLTMPQLRKAVALAITEHNISPSKGLDGRSPAQVWMQNAHRRATPLFEDPAHVRRLLGKTVVALLTRDGVEINGIRYREAAAVTRLLDNMASTAAAKNRRKDGSHTVEVKVRLSPGNIDRVEVFDTVDEEYVTLPSTQPRYTANLSEWEHKEFTRQAKRRNEPFSSEEHRLRSKGRTLALIDEMAPQVAFRARADMAALYQSHQVGKLAGRNFPMPEEIKATAVAMQRTMEAAREDAGLPHKATGVTGGNRKSKVKAPKRPVNDLGAKRLRIDWDGIRLLGENDDPESGVAVPGEAA